MQDPLLRLRIRTLYLLESRRRPPVYSSQQHARKPGRLLTLFLLLVLCSVSALPARALAQTQPNQQLKTNYFTIYYPQGEEATASWYAGFADDVDVAVSEMLGQEPVTGLTLSIYDTEADYIAANPAAATEPGIMAHSIPAKNEVGVAVERLRQAGSDVARQSFRHEMTHIVAGALSDQRLPIGFQEALAQYNELSTGRAQDSMEALKSAIAAKLPLLSWTELNDPGTFMAHAALGYPETYSIMAFLAGSYSMGTFAKFMSNLRGGSGWSEALSDAYGKRVDQLQTEWQAYLPGFLKDGWQQNLLEAYDLSPGVALYDAGQFTQAKDHFAKSQKLYTDLGRTQRANEAGDYLAKATKAEGAGGLAADARKALEAYDYTVAHDKAVQAARSFTDLGLKGMADEAGQTDALAQQGLDAMAQMESAQGALNSLNLLAARSEARTASEIFSKLGDSAHTQQANRIVSSLSATLTAAGAVVIGSGLLALLAGGFVMMRSRRVGSKSTSQSTVSGEESTSWL